MKKNYVSNMSEARRILADAFGRNDIEVLRVNDSVLVTVGGIELPLIEMESGVPGIGVRRKEFVKFYGTFLRSLNRAAQGLRQ